MNISQNGTDGRVYGGDKALVHFPDGKRKVAGELTANYVSMLQRQMAWKYNNDLDALAMNTKDPERSLYAKPLCPGCYMVAIFDAAVLLAKESGQSLKELGRSMAVAFEALKDCEDYDAACIESIAVKLDEPAPAEPAPAPVNEPAERPRITPDTDDWYPPGSLGGVFSPYF